MNTARRWQPIGSEESPYQEIQSAGNLILDFPVFRKQVSLLKSLSVWYFVLEVWANLDTTYKICKSHI